MRIDPDVKLDFKDVLIRPKRSVLNSRSEVQLERTYNFKGGKESWTGIPIVASNMDTTGTIETARVLSTYRMPTVLNKHITFKEYESYGIENNSTLRNNIFLSCGIKDEDIKNLKKAVEISSCRNVCIDVANGYTERFVNAVNSFRDDVPDVVLMAGNVVTGEMTEQLILNGVDIVKVGIGPGSVCLTRKKTGVGYPQLSAIIECSDSAHGLGGLIIADGGCTCAGDIAKAFGAGADYVMLGGMLAGHDESAGDIKIVGGEKMKLFYGMSSDYAMDKYSGGVANYRSSEGKVVEIPYRGSISNTCDDLLGGVRSACTYVGASYLKELSKRTTFIRVTQQLNNVFN